jgi:hypothetical protein
MYYALYTVPIFMYREPSIVKVSRAYENLNPFETEVRLDI